MTLRCRPGDMAIALRSANKKEGCVVEVRKFYGKSWGEIDRQYVMDMWLVEHDGLLYLARDKHLIPIRPGDLDEKEETERELMV